MSAPVSAVHRVGLAAAAVLALAALGLWSRRAPVAAPASPAAASPGTVVRATRPLMGTIFEVAVWAPAGREPEAAEAARAGLDLAAALEETISEWKPSSEMSAVNRGAGGPAVPVGPDTRDLVGAMVDYARRTDGAFDATGGPLFRLWERCRGEGRLLPPDEVRSLLRLVGWRKIELGGGAVRLSEPGMSLGTGAIGKGWAADRVGALLESKGFPDYIVDAGGDLRIGGSRGGPSWTVEVKQPRREGALARLDARPGGIATSGDYERYFLIDGVRYSHILDPRTGTPARGLSSVTVLAPDATAADALATALFVLGAEEGLAFAERTPGVQAMLVRDSGDVLLTRGLRLTGDRLEVLR